MVFLYTKNISKNRYIEITFFINWAFSTNYFIINFSGVLFHMKLRRITPIEPAGEYPETGREWSTALCIEEGINRHWQNPASNVEPFFTTF